MRTINTYFKGTAEYTFTFVADCPHDDVEDEYKAKIEITKPKEVPELHVMRESMDKYKGEEIGQEDLTEQIFVVLRGMITADKLKVTLGTSHYGIQTKTVRET